MIRAVIIEDEKPIGKDLAQKLQTLEIEVLAIIDSVESGKKYFQNTPKVDLIFADIQLGDGLSFEIFETHTIDSFIIFNTAFDAYSLQAFEHNSIDYLLKPFTTKDLEKAVQKFKKFNTQNTPAYSEAIQSFLAQQKYKNHLLIHQGNFYHSVSVDSISLAYSEFKITYILTDKKWIWDGSLSQLETELNPKHFFRINRNALIHRDFIEEIKSYRNSRLQVRMKHYSEALIVSRERVSEFKNWLGN